jgi:choline dehydrogenase-like flavoprotein
MQNILNKKWDVVVVGAGMGGSLAGYELAKSGKSILFLEKGIQSDKKLTEKKSVNLLDDPVERMQSGFWPDKIYREGDGGGTHDFFIPLGCGAGGSTKLYASQLERFHLSDFLPLPANSKIENANFLIDGWPINYHDFSEYYRRAEKLFSVSGTQDKLNFDAELFLNPPQKIGELDEKIFNTLASSGLHPYRAHVACSYVKDCNGCGGIICNKNCKNDAEKVALSPALALPNTEILFRCEVERLNIENGTITSLNCIYKGMPIHINAKLVILAAGALSSPLILFRSGNDFFNNGLANASGMVGRNLMWHASDFFAVKAKDNICNSSGVLKSTSINDFYLYKNIKLGAIQSVGVPVDYEYVYSYLFNRVQKLSKNYSKIVPKYFLKLTARVAANYFKNSSIFATIVEDFPYFDNRIIFNKDKPFKIQFKYNYSDELRLRSHNLYRNIKTVLQDEYHVIKLSRGNNINFGHACGTLRFGNDPKTSVLNQYNRAHDVSNLYVVDASFFPTSGGTNPSLTIAANALRVADYINSTH